MYSPIRRPTRTITFRPALNVMVGRWHTPAAREAVQADYAPMLALAEARGGGRLAAGRTSPGGGSHRTECVGEPRVLPGAVARLSPRRLRMAVLSSPSLTQLYRTNPEHQQHVAYNTNPARPYDIHLFDDEGQAMRWLSSVLC